MVRVKRIDTKNSFKTLFIVEVEPNQKQEFSVPIWLADLFESSIKTQDWSTNKAKTDSKDVLV